MTVLSPAPTPSPAPPRTRVPVDLSPLKNLRSDVPAGRAAGEERAMDLELRGL